MHSYPRRNGSQDKADIAAFADKYGFSYWTGCFVSTSKSTNGYHISRVSTDGDEMTYCVYNIRASEEDPDTHELYDDEVDFESPVCYVNVDNHDVNLDLCANLYQKCVDLGILCPPTDELN